MFKWRLKVPIYSCKQFLPSGAHLGGQGPPRWAPEGREVSHSVVVMDRSHCISIFKHFTRFSHESISCIVMASAASAVRCCDVIMGLMASLVTSVLVVGSTVCSSADQRKHQSSASLAFVSGIHRSPVDSPHKGPVTWKMLSFDDVIMSFVIF